MAYGKNYQLRLEDEIDKTLRVRYKKVHLRNKFINELLRKSLDIKGINPNHSRLLARRDEIDEEIKAKDQELKELKHIKMGVNEQLEDEEKKEEKKK